MSSVDKLIDHTGEFIKYWGFKSIHGKIWAYIYLSKKPRSTQEIIEKFDLSKAAISLAIKTLMDYGLIERVEKIEFGIFVYKPVLNIKKAILRVLQNREKVKLQEIIELCQIAIEERDKEYSVAQIRKVLKMTEQSKMFLEKFVFRAVDKIKG